MHWKSGIWGAIALLWMGAGIAGDVEVVQTRFQQHGNSWTVSTTLRHGDTGWDHYADAWRVVTESGAILATRTLYHPHEDEQPFTRSLSNILIPNGINLIFVEAHDKVHGWSKQRIKVDLRTDSGDRYTLRRR